MKSPWPDRSASAALAECNAPSRGRKALSAWLRRSSATNSYAAARKSKAKRFKKGSPQLPVAQFFGGNKFAGGTFREVTLLRHQELQQISRLDCWENSW